MPHYTAAVGAELKKGQDITHGQESGTILDIHNRGDWWDIVVTNGKSVKHVHLLKGETVSLHQ